MGPPLAKKIRIAIACSGSELFFGSGPPNIFPLALEYFGRGSDQLVWFFSMEQDNHTRNQSYFESWIPKYIDHDFYLLFRMKKSTFYKLVNHIGHYTKLKEYHGGPFPIELEKAILISLTYLARGETMLSIADRFNVAVSSVFNCRDLILKIISGPLMRTYIKWPSVSQARDIEAKFKKICGFPGVIGAIDGCHIKAKIPVDQHDSYQDRTFQHSISIQGICSSDKIFLNISGGFPGSLHDAGILRESTLFTSILAHGEEQYFYGKYHLLGDSAYPCKSWLIPPYRDMGNLSRKQRYFNQLLSKTRVPIENSFGLLKTRWRILQSIDTYSVRRAVQIINACCMLHNFCLLLKDGMMMEEEIEKENVPYYGEDDASGIDKRDVISDFLWQNENVL